jgi:hypothetical protein
VRQIFPRVAEKNLGFYRSLFEFLRAAPGGVQPYVPCEVRISPLGSGAALFHEPGDGRVKFGSVVKSVSQSVRAICQENKTE